MCESGQIFLCPLQAFRWTLISGRSSCSTRHTHGDHGLTYPLSLPGLPSRKETVFQHTCMFYHSPFWLCYLAYPAERRLFSNIPVCFITHRSGCVTWPTQQKGDCFPTYLYVLSLSVLAVLPGLPSRKETVFQHTCMFYLSAFWLCYLAYPAERRLFSNIPVCFITHRSGCVTWPTQQKGDCFPTYLYVLSLTVLAVLPGLPSRKETVFQHTCMFYLSAFWLCYLAYPAERRLFSNIPVCFITHRSGSVTWPTQQKGDCFPTYLYVLSLTVLAVLPGLPSRKETVFQHTCMFYLSAFWLCYLAYPAERRLFSNIPVCFISQRSGCVTWPTHQKGGCFPTYLYVLSLTVLAVLPGLPSRKETVFQHTCMFYHSPFWLCYLAYPAERRLFSNIPVCFITHRSGCVTWPTQQKGDCFPTYLYVLSLSVLAVLPGLPSRKETVFQHTCMFYLSAFWLCYLAYPAERRLFSNIPVCFISQRSGCVTWPTQQKGDYFPTYLYVLSLTVLAVLPGLPTRKETVFQHTCMFYLSPFWLCYLAYPAERRLFSNIPVCFIIHRSGSVTWPTQQKGGCFPTYLYVLSLTVLAVLPGLPTRKEAVFQHTCMFYHSAFWLCYLAYPAERRLFSNIPVCFIIHRSGSVTWPTQQKGGCFPTYLYVLSLTVLAVLPGLPTRKEAVFQHTCMFYHSAFWLCYLAYPPERRLFSNIPVCFITQRSGCVTWPTHQKGDCFPTYLYVLSLTVLAVLPGLPTRKETVFQHTCMFYHSAFWLCYLAYPPERRLFSNIPVCFITHRSGSVTWPTHQKGGCFPTYLYVLSLTVLAVLPGLPTRKETIFQHTCMFYHSAFWLCYLAYPPERRLFSNIPVCFITQRSGCVTWPTHQKGDCFPTYLYVLSLTVLAVLPGLPNRKEAVFQHTCMFYLGVLTVLPGLPNRKGRRNQE